MNAGYVLSAIVDAVEFAATVPMWTDNYHVQERLGFSSQVAPSGTSNVIVAENMLFHEFLRFGILQQINETLSFTESVQYQLAANLLTQEVLKLDATLNAEAVMTASLQTVLNMSDSTSLSFGGSVAEVLELADSVAEQVRVLMEYSEILAIAESLGEPQLWIYAPEISENLGLSDARMNMVSIQEVLKDNVSFAIRFSDGTDSYAGWALNTKRLGASNYTNFNFNSFHRRGNEVFAASDTGLYKLTGVDDAGTKIDPMVTTGLLNLANGRMSRTPSMYLGVISDTKLVVKTVTGDGTERYYESNSPQKEGVDTMRVTLGRKPAARLWQYEVTKREGDKFELSRVELLPVILTRRVPNGR